jgi:tetratricopeptide (TPR) repeat protein
MPRPKSSPAGGDVIVEAKASHMSKPWFLAPTRVPGLAVVFLVIAFLVYQPAWHAGFIWDDDDHLTANPAMTAPHGLRMIWSSMPVSRYYPLTLTSFWVQRRLWGLDPMPYHLVNIGLHAINALLVFLVLRRLRIRGALLAALIWLVHPVNVESVAWVTELKNTQSGLLFFGAILCFLQFEAQGQRRWYALALLCGAAAMLSKPSTVILPLTLLLCVWWERRHERRGWRRADVVRIGPFVGLAMGMSVLTVLEQRWQISRSGPAVWQVGMAQRLAMAGRVVWFYAAKLFWPAPLIFVYPRWTLETASFRFWIPLVGLVAVGIALGAWRRHTAGRAGIFAVGVFVTALLPVLGFFDIYYFHYSFVADHFQYLASVGLIALATGAGMNLTARAGKWGREIGVVASCAVLLTLGALTWRQAQVYRDNETLWSDTLAKNPDCWMAEHNLANLLLHRGDVPAAIAHWERALQIDPHLPEVYNNLGTVFFKMGNVPEAIRRWEQAVDSDPDYFGAHFNLGVVLVQQGRVTEGLGHLEQAVRIDSDSLEARLTLAAALVQAGKRPEAIAELEQAVRINPDSAPARSRLAWLLATAPSKGGDAARAVGQAQRACELTGNRLAADLDVLAIAYAATGRFDDAVVTAQKALELARTASQPKLAGEIEARLELYRSGRAYHPSSSTAATSPPSP